MALVTGLLLVISGTLEIAGAFPWPFGSAHVAAQVEMVPTPTPTKAPTPTPKPKPKPTPTPVANGPVYIPPAGTYNLGCGSPGPQALSFVVRNWSATHSVAITFDDGPSPDYTNSILSTLEQTHTPATFFVVGSNVQSYPDKVQREVRDGDAIGMHTWNHPYMTQISPTDRAWELTSTIQAIHNAMGANYCIKYWRPPFGDYNAAVLQLTSAMGLTTVTWSVDPQDWASPGVQVIVARVVQYAQAGSIILLHDGYFGRWQTAQALPLIIQQLKAKGFTFVTVPQLLAGGQ
jgi:peptidoglycan/xylan/chitin deacetylase (PgdA/CDA1 family)